MSCFDRDPASTALDNIALALSGKRWNADTLERVAEIVRGTGRVIHDVNLAELASVDAPRRYPPSESDDTWGDGHGGPF